MEKKTKKAKLEIFKFLRKSALSQGYSLDKIGGYYALSKFYKNMLIRVFLHAEFISAMKTVLNPTQKNIRKSRKMNNFGNFCIIF